MHPRTITTNTVALYTESIGNPGDPAILLIMGAMASATWWPEELCRRLAGRGRYVIRYDHRDTGQSTSAEPGSITYSVEDLADDAIAILDAYGIQRAHLVGMSLGGILAQLLALKYPGRVISITMIASEPLATHDPAIPTIDQRVLDYHTSAGELDWTDREAVLDYQVGAWRLLTGSGHPFDEEAIRTMAAIDFDRTPNPLSAMNHAMLAGGEQWYNRLDEIDVPALVIHGTEDIVLPYAHARALVEAIPGATLVTLEGSGHELHRDDWDVLIDAIERHTGSA